MSTTPPGLDHYGKLFGEQKPRQYGERTALANAIGAVLRAARRAAEISTNHGARQDIADCAREIRAAADRISALCVSVSEGRQ